MELNNDREYVLLSVKWTRGSLMFWGGLTPDESERRSFGGYTDDITACERYTYNEARKERIEFHDYEGHTLREMYQIDDEGTWIIRISDLEKLGRLVSHYIC